MKFAHMSDVHLGAWGNHPELRELPQRAFAQAVDECLAHGIDFLIIAGDLFDTSVPAIDVINVAARKLRECRDAGVRVYAVPGSHDFSPTGKTMLAVLDSAGLLHNVAAYDQEGDNITLRFVSDPAGAKITGLPGKIGSLEHSIYDNINREALEREPGFKIFVMHSAIEEFRPAHLEKMAALPIAKLPRNFDYYANGHVHQRFSAPYDRGVMNMPGPMFPTSFGELEDYMSGYYIVHAGSGAMDVKWHRVKLCDVVKINVSAEGKSVTQVESEIVDALDRDLANVVVLVRAKGALSSGRPGEVDFRKISALALEKGAIALKKNVSKLSAKEFVEVTQESVAIEGVEKEIIENHRAQMALHGFDVGDVVQRLMHALHDEKREGETVATFEERIRSNAKNVLEIQ